jgi:transposase
LFTLDKERAMGKEAKYIVRLTHEERQYLEDLIKSRRVAKDKALRARMLLKADADGPAWTDSRIADAFDVGTATVHRLRQRLVQEGFDVALARKAPIRTKPRKLDGAQEARLVAIACSSPPAGRNRWTLQLLAEKLVELHVVDDTVSGETVRRTLKKTNSSLGCSSNGSFLRRPTPSSSVRWRTR